jgi:hypothetical protein
MTKTLCGYTLLDVRKSLREAIGRRDRRASNRWVAELVATPAAIGSLWASYWLSCEASVDGNPSLPLLLGQTWTTLVQTAQAAQSNWTLFRNDEAVRRTVAEITCRLLDYPRQTMPSLPVKDVALYDVSTILEKPMPASADSPIVLGVWSRNHDSMELRHLAGHWIDSLHSGEMRLSVSILVWSLLPTTKLKCGPRGPSGSKDSPIWYWFSLGAALLKAKSLHPGWLTFHDTTVDAMKTHYRHWSAAERLKILMFWTLNLRACIAGSKESWTIGPITLSTEEIDLPYKEIANELGSKKTVVPIQTKVESKPETKAEKLSQKMKAADDTVLAMFGVI